MFDYFLGTKFFHLFIIFLLCAEFSSNFWKYKNKSLVNPKVEKEKLFLRYILPTATVKKRKEKEKAVGKENNY